MAGVTRSGFATWAWRHRVGLLRATLALLLAIVILQNLEPTTIDVLFWQVTEVPKLVLILVSMALGVGLWSILKRL